MQVKNNWTPTRAAIKTPNEIQMVRLYRNNILVLDCEAYKAANYISPDKKIVVGAFAKTPGEFDDLADLSLGFEYEILFGEIWKEQVIPSKHFTGQLANRKMQNEGAILQFIPTGSLLTLLTGCKHD